MARIGLASVLVTAAAISLSPPLVYAADAFGDFSVSTNPNGAWTYGQMASIASPFTVLATPSGLAGNQMQGWADLGSLFPFVLRNQTLGVVQDGGTYYQPGLLAMHPSPGGALSAIRWLAPATGQYAISATFSGVPHLPASEAPTTTDVHILLDGTSVFDGALDAGTTSRSFSGIRQIGAGQAVIFAVGFGSNLNYANDHTGFSGSISAVPEAPILAMLVSGILLIGLFRSHASRAVEG